MSAAGLSILLCLSIGLALTVSGSTPSMLTLQSHGSIVSLFPLHVSGNQILNVNNKTVILKGIARMGLEYDESGTYRETNPAYYAQDFALMKGWGVNFIRIAFNRYFYNTSSSYRSLLQTEVKACIVNGFYVLLDMHWFQSSQFPDGLWLNNNSITSNVNNFDIENEAALAWLQRTTYPTIRSLVQSYNSSYYGSVMGFEINEFYPDANRIENFLVQTSIMRNLADYVHLNCSCPKYLMFFQPWGESKVFYSSVYRVPTSDSQEIVYAPHFYIDPNYSPWYSGFLGPNDGWNWTAYYEAGDDAKGKAAMYTWLNLYTVNMTSKHNVPCVFDEIGVDDNCSQGLDDMLSFFESHGYGYNYWSWYGSSNAYGSGVMNLLMGDWLSIRANAYVLIRHLNCKHFFQWENTPLTLDETYNGTSGSTTEAITYPPVTTILSDGFESGTLSAWKSATGGVTVATSQVYDGSYSMKANSSQGSAVVDYDYGSSSELYGRCYVYFSNFPTNNGILQLCMLYGANWAPVATLGLTYRSGQVQWDFIYYNGAQQEVLSTSNVPSVNTWNCIQVHYKSGSGNGVAEAWINGKQLFSYTGLTNTGNGNPSHWVIGANQFYESPACVWYFDNATLANYIMPNGSIALPPGTTYMLQFYALNVTAYTQISLSNGTVLAALPYWNSDTKLLSFQIGPDVMSITVSDPTLT